jgi:N-acylneuraminate cytidylyltransferase
MKKIDDESYLVIIPARGGSKGIKNKNKKKIHGKPLIEWTINEAKKIFDSKNILLSTDDNEIVKIGLKNKIQVPFLRPKSISKDTTAGVKTIIHALKYFPNAKNIMLLQPTSPLRSAEDIREMIIFYKKNKFNSVVSISAVLDHPRNMFSLEKKSILKKMLKFEKEYYTRQKYEKIFRVNGAMYLAKREWILKTKSVLTEETAGFIMPIERSIDIDNNYEWDIAEFLLKKNNK